MYQVTSKTSTITTTNEFSNEYNYIFVNDQQAAYETLKAAGVEMDFENEEEAWTDIVCDNSDPNYREWFAVYGTGSKMSNSHAEYVKINPTETHKQDLIAFMPEW